MLLSRVAEDVYWTGRYLERAEATARLVRVHTETFIDLPRAAGLGWWPLLAVTGTGDAYSADHAEAAEDDVVAFLTVDPANPGSVLSCVTTARDNLRRTRPLLPSPAWEVVNELYLWATATVDEAVERRTRISWMRSLVRQCQLFAGLVAGTMNHDHTHSFLEIGRAVERADMTTRVLDVGAGTVSGWQRDGATPYADLAWVGVLRSVAADQMFRLASPGELSGPEVLRFLLRHPQFPRSVEHCLTVLSRALLELPRYGEPMAACAAVQAALEAADTEVLAAAGLHEFVDAVQRGLGEVHEALERTYFRAAPLAAAV